jgi:hypothetical protein
MAVNPIDRSLGLKYPDTPDELVVFVQRVMGPLVAQIKARYNELPIAINIRTEEDIVALAAVDTTDMPECFLGIAQLERSLFSLDKTSLPSGPGDLAAIPAGRWYLLLNL